MISIYLDFQHLVDEGADKLCLRSVTHVVLMLFRMAALLSGGLSVLPAISRAWWGSRGSLGFSPGHQERR